MRVTCRLLQRAAKALEQYSQYNPLPLSIKKFIEFGSNGSKSGSLTASYQFLRKELPVRLANIMKEISLLPDNLLHMPSVTLVMSWYEQSFRELIQFETSPTPGEDILQKFTDTLVHKEQAF